MCSSDLDEPGKNLEESRFPGPIAPNHGKPISTFQFKFQPTEQPTATETLAEVGGAEH